VPAYVFWLAETNFSDFFEQLGQIGRGGIKMHVSYLDSLAYPTVSERYSVGPET
jgi:hypothetical protein